MSDEFNKKLGIFGATSNSISPTFSHTYSPKLLRSNAYQINSFDDFGIIAFFVMIMVMSLIKDIGINSLCRCSYLASL